MATPDGSLAARELDDEVFMSAADLKGYMAKVEMAKMSKEMVAQDQAAKAKEELIRTLSERIIFTPERMRAFLGRVKLAAERGETELMIGRFPVELCTDHGRAINNNEAEWPETLTGLPRQAYEIWKEKLQPLGYRLSAMIVDWPHGLPGEVGLFLSWK
jgi:hypothetical protein